MLGAEGRVEATRGGLLERDWRPGMDYAIDAGVYSLDEDELEALE